MSKCFVDEAYLPKLPPGNTLWITGDRDFRDSLGLISRSERISLAVVFVELYTLWQALVHQLSGVERMRWLEPSMSDCRARPTGRVGSGLAVLDFLHLGSTVSLRSFSRVGSPCSEAALTPQTHGLHAVGCRGRLWCAALRELLSWLRRYLRERPGEWRFRKRQLRLPSQLSASNGAAVFCLQTWVSLCKRSACI